MVGYVPLIMRSYTYIVDLTYVEWGGMFKMTDYYLYGKMIVVISLTFYMLLVLAYRKAISDVTLKVLPKEFILIFVYLLFVFISGVFCKWSLIAFSGSFEMFQSVPIVFCYMIILIYAYETISSISDFKYLLKGALPGIVIELLIGLSQIFGHDILTNNYIQKVISPQGNSFTSVVGIPVMTFYNPDYTGMYLAMIIPIVILLGLALSEYKNKKAKILYTIAYIAMLVSIICIIIQLDVDSVYVSLTGCFILGLAIIANNRKRLFMLGGFILIITVVAVALIYILPTLKERITNSIGAEVNHTKWLKDFETTEEGIQLYYDDGTTLNVQYNAVSSENKSASGNTSENNQPLLELKINDTDGKKLIPKNPSHDELNYYLKDTYYTLVDRGEYNDCLRVISEEYEYDFIKIDDKYYFLTMADNPVSVTADSIPYAKVFPEALFSGRGWIWNQTLPLLKDTIIVGSGSGCFIYVFPHSYVHYGFTKDTDVKPHNIYLQQWIENGFFAFFSWTTFYFIYFFKSIIIYRKNEIRNQLILLGFFVFLSTVIYMIYGITNDQMICVAPVYYVLFGIGLRMNEEIQSCT